jgi:hypothetical protein
LRLSLPGSQGKSCSGLVQEERIISQKAVVADSYGHDFHSLRHCSCKKEAFIRELLPIIDNLERALASEPFYFTRTTSAGRPDDPPTTHPTAASPRHRT